MIFIVVHEMGEYSDYSCWNEQVFKDNEEAVRFVKSKGYTERDGKYYVKPGKC